MIYFDNAATTLKKPDGVAQAVSDAIMNLGNAGRGAYDASLHSMRMALPYLEQLACYPLKADKFCCIVSRSSPLAQLKSVPISEFLQYPLALTQSDHFLKYIFERYGEFTVGFSSNNPQLYLQALSSGRYVGLTTEAIHQQRDLRSPTYQQILILPFSENLGFHNCLLGRRQLSPHPPKQAFIEHIQKHLTLL